MVSTTIVFYSCDEISPLSFQWFSLDSLMNHPLLLNKIIKIFSNKHFRFLLFTCFILFRSYFKNYLSSDVRSSVNSCPIPVLPNVYFFKMFQIITNWRTALRSLQLCCLNLSQKHIKLAAVLFPRIMSLFFLPFSHNVYFRIH